MKQTPSEMPEKVYIGLGSSLGDRLESLERARKLLSDGAVNHSISKSTVFESEPHVLDDRKGDPDFLNQVISFETELAPADLMHLCLSIESTLGRERLAGHQWLPRTIDIDVLVYGERTIWTRGLKVPHPRLGDRRFVLEPLAEIDAGLMVPFPFDRSASELLNICPDRKGISHYLMAS